MNKLLLLAICIPFYSLCYAAPDAGFDQFVKSKMKKYHVPGASIAIIKNNKISFAQAYGYADLDSKRKMTTDTMLEACSITKTTTSLAVLLSFYKNNLNINAPANNYLISWKIPTNKFTAKQPVTVRMLLDHSAGILNPYSNSTSKSEDQPPTALQMVKGEKPAGNPPFAATYIPGSKYEYCNGCYVVLQILLEDVNHELYTPIMQTLVLTPLKMQHSTFDMAAILEHPDTMALPYKPDGKVYGDTSFMRMLADPEIRKRDMMGNAGISVGGLLTTPSDLGTFAIAIQESLANKQGSYIPHEIASLMVKPSSTKTRGLGFFITNKYGDETKNGNYFMHGGFNTGYLAIFVASKSFGGDGAVIMVNVSPDYHTQDVYEWGFIKDVERYIADHGHWK